jgi:predicted metal-dependent phosphoesterase TrpH
MKLPQMSMQRRWAVVLLVLALGLGALADRAPAVPVQRDAQGRLILHADFHVHAGLGDGAIPPWNIPREARRRGLHALAITNHNQVFAARLGRHLNRWWSGDKGPLVLIGQEVTNPGYHIVAVGIDRAVDWDLPPQQIVADIHAQGGRAIAAHPERPYWPAFDAVAMNALDGAERRHPVILRHPERQADLEGFFERASPHRENPLAAIGSSDFHALSTIGRCRTLLNARELSERAVLQAIADGQTVARCFFPQTGDRPRSAGDAGDDRAPFANPALSPSGVLGWLALLGLIVLPRKPGFTLLFEPRTRRRTRRG